MISSKAILYYFIVFFLVFGCIGCKRQKKAVFTEEKITYKEDDFEITYQSLIRNGFFEEDYNNWQHGKFFNDTIKEGIGIDGSRALEIIIDHNCVLGGLSQNIAWNNKSDYILVEGWIKTEELVDAEAFIFIQCMDEEKTAEKDNYGVLRAVSTERIGGTTDWKKVSMGLKIPEKTDYIVTSIVVFPVQGTGPHINHYVSGRAYFDNISVYPANLKAEIEI